MTSIHSHRDARHIAFALLLFVPALAMAAAPPPKTPQPTASKAEISAVVQAENEFAIDLYRQLAGKNEGKSVLISPLSIGTALTMAAEGAVDETAREMRKTLHLPEGDLAGVHRGSGALLAQLTLADDKPELAAKIAKLRADLNAANEKTQALIEANKYREAETQSEIGEKLARDLNQLLKSTRPYELRIANALWAEKTYPFSPKYLETLQPNYGAVFFPIDFKRNFEAGRETINLWVSKQTNDRIQNLLGPGVLNGRTRLVITNTTFFLGEWEQPFAKYGTKEAVFHVDNQTERKVTTMHDDASAGYAAYSGDGSAFNTPREIPIDMKPDDPSLYPDDKGYVALSLPYRGGKLAMTIVLPRSVEGLAALEEQLTAKMLASWKGGERRRVEVYLPKFKLEGNYGLNEPLMQLGMKRAFEDTVSPSGAQFDKMTTSKLDDDRLYITNVLHKTFMEVNEKGTEAAAASAVVFAAPTAAPPGDFERPKTKPFTPTFRADHPYLCLIQDRETGAVLFLGRVIEPK